MHIFSSKLARFLTYSANQLALLFCGIALFSDVASAQLQNGSETTSQFYDGGTVMVFAHQDDDILWMYPFLSMTNKFYLTALPASDTHYNKILKAYSYQYQTRWTPLKGFTNDSYYVSTWLNACTRPISYNSIYQTLKPIVSASTTKRIITHNNWGEYGHIHHKWINQAVRSLAVTYNKDVWMNMVAARADIPGYYVGKGNAGLPYIRGYFDYNGLNTLRSVYQRTYLSVPVNGQPYDVWTWHDGTYDYPTEWRAFVKAVKRGASRGVDLSISNSTVIATTNEYASINVGKCQ